jgi:MCM P-loop domain/Toprim-like
MTHSAQRGAGWEQRFARWLAATQPDASGEWRAYCPLHEDPGTSNSESASLNFGKGVWHCKSCGEGGSLENLAKRIEADDFNPGNSKSSTSFFNENEKWNEDEDETAAGEPPLGSYSAHTELPSEADIKLWNKRLLGLPKLLQFLMAERGLEKSTIEEFMLGYDGHRYTIPIYDSAGTLVNVRRYDPNAKRAGNKMISITGHGQARLFMPWALAEMQSVILCEGEMDCIIARQHGLPALTHTAGSQTWDQAWSPLFRDKHVAIVYDNDNAGLKGAKKVANSLLPHAKSVRVVQLKMLDPGGDITDWFVKGGYTATGLRELINGTEPYVIRKEKAAAPTSGTPVSIEESMAANHSGPLELTVMVAGKQAPPYVVPRKVRYTCTQDKGDVCTICPMSAWGGEREEELPAHDPILLEFLDEKKKARSTVLKDFIGAKCLDRLNTETLEAWTVEDLVVTNSLEYRDDAPEQPASRRLHNVGTHRTPVNTTVRVLGAQYPDPRTQRGVFLGWSLEQTRTDLDTFVLTPDMADALRVFQPGAGQSPLQRMGDIARDLSANVTHIYGRPELHIAYDLVWHSAIDFQFQGARVVRGWLEALVIGDTRTGKSEAAQRMAQHYRAGVVKSCEGATYAGLVGGVQQMAQRWMVTWGAIPLNDRRLVVLDEMSGLRDRDVLENMSAIRSSGRAQLTKISQEETSARTRLVWISNPVDGKRLAEISGGAMDGIRGLVKNPEDVARFDFALAASGGDVDTALINSTSHEQVPHVFTSDLCASLVLWVWSRTPDQVSIHVSVQNYLVAEAEKLGRRYVPDPPLIQAENVRVKMARLAVAIAARTFSTNEDCTRIVVRREHVDSAVAYLDYIYGRGSFGYKRHSTRTLRVQDLARQNKEECRRWLLVRREDILRALLMADTEFKTRDFRDFVGMLEPDAQAATAQLLRWNMVRSGRRGFVRMQPALIELLGELEDSA